MSDGGGGDARAARPLRAVVIGGGTGISACLEGIKRSTDDIVAIVTVADDGGSSGRLRKDYHMPPPGDIRNCLVALSSSEPILADLFNFRFDDSILRGHSFGNLFLAVLTHLTGDFRVAIERARALLHVKGRVIPSTDTRVVLVATHADGTKSTGEQCISRCGKPIEALALRPEPPPVSQEIEDAVMTADLIVLGPGSLFTSIIPNLLVPGMAALVGRAPGRVVVVMNLMTQPGETDAFDVARHLEALRRVGGLDRIDVAVVNSGAVPDEVRERYRSNGATVIGLPEGVQRVAGVPVVTADIVTILKDDRCRHDPGKLASLLEALARRPAPAGEARG